MGEVPLYKAAMLVSARDKRTSKDTQPFDLGPLTESEELIKLGRVYGTMHPHRGWVRVQCNRLCRCLLRHTASGIAFPQGYITRQNRVLVGLDETEESVEPGLREKVAFTEFGL